MGKGKVTYVPKIVFDELDDLRQEEKIPQQGEAFKKMVQYSEVGREVNRIANLNFHHKPMLLGKERKKKKRKGGLF